MPKACCEPTMRAAILWPAAFLLVVSCGPARESSTDQEPAASAGQTTNAGLPPSDVKSIQHFWFAYPFQPQPGSRVWINVSQTNWVEVYPDGTQSRYRLLRSETVDGLNGVVVSKTAGDVQASRTLNDGSFEAFIPDHENARLNLYFRNRINDVWQPWRPLAEIHPIE